MNKAPLNQQRLDPALVDLVELLARIALERRQIPQKPADLPAKPQAA